MAHLKPCKDQGLVVYLRVGILDRRCTWCLLWAHWALIYAVEFSPHGAPARAPQWAATVASSFAFLVSHRICHPYTCFHVSGCWFLIESSSQESRLSCETVNWGRGVGKEKSSKHLSLHQILTKASVIARIWAQWALITYVHPYQPPQKHHRACGDRTLFSVHSVSFSFCLVFEIGWFFVEHVGLELTM